ncbi:MAG: NAD(P)/FAD-dependent oxidoreductase [Thermoanaerobaculia bacterium]
MESRDIVVLGAGISGSSTAIRLQEAGLNVLLVDQADFPRDTAGEGISPAITPFLAELGILDTINQPPFVKKRSFQFVSPSGDKGYTAVDLSKPPYKDGVHSYPWGFNVQRYYFDMVFLDRAKAVGAEVRLKTRARNLVLDSEGVVTGVALVAPDGHDYEVKSRLVIDCTGRQSMVARQLALRAPLEHVFEGQWANFAVRCHFRNVNMQPLMADNPRYDPATVNIFPSNDCWLWFIPINLEQGLISIGFVARSRVSNFFEGMPNKKEGYRELFARHQVVRKVIEKAELDDNIVSTGRLGHMNSRMAGDGFLCVGDAAFFADPAWGTGVTICLASSKMAAETAVEAARQEDFSNGLLQQYERRYREMIRCPFNSIRAYNYYYNDTEYINFITRRLAKNQNDMDMLGAVLFDYASHEEFQSWTFREFKAYVAETGRMPAMERVSQLDFDTGRFPDGEVGVASGRREGSELPAGVA